MYDTWEYLTIRNYAARLNNSVWGTSTAAAVRHRRHYKYDTIGPNNTGSRALPCARAENTAAPGNGGGYAIDGSNYTTIEYDCLTRDAQGGFNVSGALDLVSNNEISCRWTRLYPDTGSSPGQSPYACGCSGGGKVFFTLNADVVNNYVHDNYNAGIWFDFDNSGAISQITIWHRTGAAG